MSKSKDMLMTIEGLRNAAAAITDAANWLAEQFTGDGDVSKEVEEPVKQLTLEEVRAVLATASRNGHTAEIRSLLQKYGGSKLSEIAPASYQALLEDVEVLNNAT